MSNDEAQADCAAAKHGTKPKPAVAAPKVAAQLAAAVAWHAAYAAGPQSATLSMLAAMAIFEKEAPIL